MYLYRYYLEVIYRCNNGTKSSLRVHQFEATVNERDFPGAIDEVQRIAISSTISNMEQVQYR